MRSNNPLHQGSPPRLFIHRLLIFQIHFAKKNTLNHCLDRFKYNHPIVFQLRCHYLELQVIPSHFLICTSTQKTKIILNVLIQFINKKKFQIAPAAPNFTFSNCAVFNVDSNVVIHSHSRSKRNIN